MKLNDNGEIVKQIWYSLPNHYEVELDEFVIMPNHVHGNSFVHEKIKSILELIGAFKTTSSKIIHQEGLFEFKWQRSYYDRIIRNEHELLRIRQYIKDNPVNWKYDRNSLFGGSIIPLI